MKNIIFKSIDVLLSPLTLITALWMKFLIRGKIKRTLLARRIFMKVGILPVRDHYYSPMINPKKHLKRALEDKRNLPGIDFNDELQLEVLQRFNYEKELLSFPLEKNGSAELGFYYDNPSFKSGDAEYLYSMIRSFRPRRVIEIGSGYSTLLAIEALKKNEASDQNYSAELLCVEPYEQPWLEKTSARIVREKVEDLDLATFEVLQRDDILFIDSSHIIRPQGDVLFEYLEIFPNLNPGVLVHVHDIFSPRDYLREWIYNDHVLWNEQYLLEAFLSHNDSWEIMGAVNYLFHNHRSEVLNKCPVLKQQHDRQPGSFWIRKK